MKTPTFYEISQAHREICRKNSPHDCPACLLGKYAKDEHGCFCTFMYKVLTRKLNLDGHPFGVPEVDEDAMKGETK